VVIGQRQQRADARSPALVDRYKPLLTLPGRPGSIALGKNPNQMSAAIGNQRGDHYRSTIPRRWRRQCK